MSFSRIDKILSHEGFGSRKAIRKILRECEVTVNGERIFDSGFSVDPDSDEIKIDGEVLNLRKNFYIMMNKPADFVSANKDGLHRTVFELLDERFHTPFLEENLHLVGRLDVDTEGLLLFTTDGALTHRITSPKTHLFKSYFVTLRDGEEEGRRTEIASAFKKGIEIPPEGNEAGALLKPAELDWKDEKNCILSICEGKFHQVKRMFAAVGNEVVYLKRLSIGELKLDESLKTGEYRELTEDERKLLVENNQKSSVE